MIICKKISQSIILSALIIYSPLKCEAKPYQIGRASYYSSKFNKKKTASGEKFNNNSLIAAHRTLPFGTKIKVTNIKTNKSIIVRIIDRGPFIKNRILDVSNFAAKKLGMIDKGTASVRLEIVKNNFENT